MVSKKPGEKHKPPYQKIQDLYQTLEEHGLRIPKIYEGKREDTLDSVNSLLSFYEATKPITSTIAPTSLLTALPEELQGWLDVDTDEWKAAGVSPEYLQETVYESLKAKYRPQTGVDKNTYLPIYDDTYKDMLLKILRRFDDYEEEYVEEETK